MLRIVHHRNRLLLSLLLLSFSILFSSSLRTDHTAPCFQIDCFALPVGKSAGRIVLHTYPVIHGSGGFAEGTRAESRISDGLFDESSADAALVPAEWRLDLVRGTEFVGSIGHRGSG